MVTAVMLTYGAHKNETEEAIESFLRQDYPDKKLLIVNTHPDPVIFEGAEIHNIPDMPLKDVSHYAMCQVKTPLLCIMDDDDIFLPWHISQLMRHRREAGTGKKLAIIQKHHYLSALRARRLTLRVGAWASAVFETPTKEALDIILERTTTFYDASFRRNPIWDRVIIDERPSLINRRGALGQWSNRRQGVDRIKKNVYRNRILEPFVPHWDIDYVKLAEEFERGENENT